MRRYLFGLAMCTIAAIVPVAAQADQQQDQQIAKTVVERLQKEKAAGRLKGFNIDLEVEDGTLWLSGRVTDKSQQTLALDIARRVSGVKQVVNDLSIAPVAATAAQAATPAAKPQVAAQPVATTVPVAAQPVATTVPVATPVVGAGVSPAAAPAASVASRSPAPAPNFNPGPIPVQPQSAAHPGNTRQVPVAYAPAHSIHYAQYQNAGGCGPGGCAPGGYGGGGYGGGGYGGGYGPAALPQGGMAPARYDSPQMPCYAWPSYASSPNYGAVTYPKQYSASAWPYIGPFYPYPQVPLGWRKVSLEWDDGWWFVDFKDRNHR